MNAWNPRATLGTAMVRDYGYWVNAFTSFVANWSFGLVRTAPVAGKELAEVAVGPKFADVNEKYIDCLTIKKSANISYDTNIQDDLWATSVELAKLTELESPLIK